MKKILEIVILSLLLIPTLAMSGTFINEDGKLVLKTRFHKSFQPHSLTTYHEKCLALVIWRDKLNSEIKVVKN